MDRLTSLQVFREVVDAGSFAAAAKRLSMSAPMVSKHLALLERELGARLLNRSNRRLSLTEEGRVYDASCREALDALATAADAIGHRSVAPRGLLKVSAPVWCATPGFAAALADYRERCPEVLVEMRLENRKVDLVAEGYDLALRVTAEPAPTLIARPLARLPFYLVASPGFVKRHGTPQRAADLARYPAILPTYVSLDGLTLQGPQGNVRVPLTAALRTDDSTLAYHSVHAHLGLSYLPEWLVAGDLRDGRLVRLLPDHAQAPLTLYAIYTSRQYMAPKLRSFIDFFSARLAGASLGGVSARAAAGPARPATAAPRRSRAAGAGPGTPRPA